MDGTRLAAPRRWGPGRGSQEAVRHVQQGATQPPFVRAPMVIKAVDGPGGVGAPDACGYGGGQHVVWHRFGFVVVAAAESPQA
ncbi:MAG: hypothetical protein ACRDRK_21545 [Pseudonocardia sp.]